MTFPLHTVGVSLVLPLLADCSPYPHYPQVQESINRFGESSRCCPYVVYRVINSTMKHNRSVLLSNLVGECLYLVVDVSLFTHQFVNLCGGMHHRCVIASTESITDLR